ncbi:hypothetical protein [Amedibacterium intestinale]|uniref:hypothetical protein n=1 Tax=Amedibacterium intestinale TaxID=2583452 RepID=UPI000E203B49
MKLIENVYPTEIKLKHSINEGLVEDCKEKNKFYHSKDSIELVLKIDNSNYPKDKVKEAVKEICQKAVEYFY